ncbi:MAG: hypothetical protein AB7K63_13960 [Vicinamibacterales bacterium]
MKRVTAITAVLVAAVLVAFSMNVRAQDLNPQEKTYLTFSGPVELPGMTLPAGTYTFRLADTPGRNVVQVLSQDEQTIHGQFLFVQANRTEPTGETVVTFRETAEGATPAVQYWYYPGESIGKELVYPKDQAMRIAARTNSTVLSVDGEIGPEASVSSVDSQGNVTPWDREQQRSAQAPSPDTSAPAQPTAAAGSLAGNRGTRTEQTPEVSADTRADQTAVGTSGADAPAPAQAEGQFAGNELPRTASPLALTGLIGLFSLMGGIGVRAMRR